MKNTPKNYVIRLPQMAGASLSAKEGELAVRRVSARLSQKKITGALTKSDTASGSGKIQFATSAQAKPKQRAAQKARLVSKR